MTERSYTVQLTYEQLQMLIALVDNERHAIESWRGDAAQERWRVLGGLRVLLLAAVRTTA